MIIVMKNNAAKEQIRKVVEWIESIGYNAHLSQGVERTLIGAIGDGRGKEQLQAIGSLPGVEKVVPILKPYKLASREFKASDTVVRVGDLEIGGPRFIIMAGPCTVESEEQLMESAYVVKKGGGHVLRGGAFKPRTSPYAFQGLGEEGLKILAKVRQETGMPVVTEAMDHEVYDLVEEYADVVQIGARNMQNFSLLRRAGRSPKPVLLKRGLSATIDEWLMAAEYVMEGGNHQVILCERGVRTFAHHSRNTLDLSAVLVVIKESHLPVIVDPSHAAGRRDQVIPLSRAAVALGCHGLMVEVHHAPEQALSDGAQSLYPDQFAALCEQIRPIFGVFSQQVH